MISLPVHTMRTILLVLPLLCGAVASAQPTYIWSQNLDCFGGQNSASCGVSIALDTSGNVISGGWYTDFIDLDPGAGNYVVGTLGNTAGYISKLDATGAFVWGASIGDPYAMVNSVAVDDSNNVYAVGQFTGTCDFDPGPGVHNLQSTTLDVFILKLSPAGNLLWAYRIGGNGQDNASRLTIDDNNDLLITGTFCVTADFDPGPGTYTLVTTGCFDGYFLKLSPSGSFIFAGSFVSTALADNFPLDIETDEWGNIYITGRFVGPGPVDFDPGSGQSDLFPVGSVDGFLVKLNAAGQFVWVKRMGFLQYDAYREIEIGSDNKLTLFGYFTGTADLDPGPGTASHTSTGDADPFLCRLDSAGNLIWACAFGGAQFSSANEIVGIAVDSAGHTFIIGQFDEGTDWDPAAGTTTLPPTPGRDVVICAYDNAGQLMWANQFPGRWNNEGFGVATDGFSLYYTGSYQDSLDCDPSAASAWLDAAVFQSSFIGRYTGIVTDVAEAPGADSFLSLFPNPASGQLNVTSACDLEEIIICDAAGRTVYTERFGNGTRTVQLDLALVAGMYVIGCRDTEGKTITQRFIVQ
jgi:hypothetical protein